MRGFDRVYAKVHLDHIEENMRAVLGNLLPETKVIGVVKADGYGHGAVPVAKTIEPYVAAYAVATAEEAFQLRKNGIQKDILILGVVPESMYPDLIREDISLTVFQPEKAKVVSELACSLGKKAKLHVAVDTGMSRIGLMPTEEAAEIAAEMGKLSGIELRGMFTHFARADEADKTATMKQFEKFQKFKQMLKNRGVEISICHCSNSAAIVDMQEANMDMVRAGIMIYGMYPSDEVKKEKVLLKPAMELKSFITYIKEVEAGVEVSYGGTFCTERKTRIATISVGYADGYPRNLSGRGHVLVCGKKVPILGRVCMDQCMIDVTDVPETKEGMEVTLLGRDGDLEITMEELAADCGGFHYEIPCLIGKRVPRLYVSGGQVVGTMEFPDGEYEGF